jgi:hypothetical protein
MTRRLARTLLLVAPLVAMLSGCTSIELALGVRTRLDSVPISSLSGSLSPGPALAPGQSARLIIVATTTDGKQLLTVGAGHGEVLFDSFDFSASLVTVDRDGVVTVPADPRITDGYTPRIRVLAQGHPGVWTDVQVPLRYDIAYRANFSGQAGASGFDGLDGLDGMSGSSGSIDLNNPSAGGNGTDGSDGGNGGDGSSGQPGEAVHVWLTVAPSGEADRLPRLQARVASSTHEQFYLIDSAGGSLEVDANGGPGGAAGRGGRGGRGGAGGSGWPGGMAGHDGLDGHDGSPGAPGAAGTILVSVDPEADVYLDHLRLSNKDGDRRQGPAAVVRIEPVPAMW